MTAQGTGVMQRAQRGTDVDSMLTSRDWGWRCRRCSGALCQPCSARSPQSRSTSDPISQNSIRPPYGIGCASARAHALDSGTHLLHLRQHILVRRELAIEAEELLLLLREFLSHAREPYVSLQIIDDAGQTTIYLPLLWRQ